jgi:adenine-specific DNA-methyltransferase
MAKKQLQKLELTWIGKGDEPKLEPRILVEQPEFSYGVMETENIIIHGDNLLALKALEQEFASQVKCIYIDPPFNVDAAGVPYDDNVEHSIWLGLMKNRLNLLYKLLSKDGTIWISIDDLEMHYLKIICDEIFLRENFIATIAVRSSTPSGPKTKHKDKKMIKQKDFILVYRKSKDARFNPQYIRKNKWDTHFNYFINKDTEEAYSLLKTLKSKGILNQSQKLSDFDINNSKHFNFYQKNKHLICQTQSFKNKETLAQSRLKKDKILFINKGEENETMFYNGRQLTPLANSMNEVIHDKQYIDDFSILLCDFWSDIDFQNTQNEGGVSFPNSKKPETLVQRVLNLATNKGDLVLDSFLGSGTTAAVAHKMGRKYIGIELGNHAYTHCLPRLKNIIDCNDNSGISQIENWKGGGGFKFYTLAPSLLQKDKYGNWIIDEKYNADMLAAAMAKQEGFHYQPDLSKYWKQGNSTEKDYIYTTTQFITVETLDKIYEEMQPDESLLLCCKAFSTACKNKFTNISIKKIPQMLLGRCEFGKDDYSLNIINIPFDRVEEEFRITEDTSIQELNTIEKNEKSSQRTLFD